MRHDLVRLEPLVEPMSHGLELLTTVEMARADRLAVEAGVPSLTLMENAGRAVADAAETLVERGARIAVLCGPGNNGGDGFVAARHLSARGYPVEVACLVPLERLSGDAAEMAGRWSGATKVLDRGCALPNADLVVDALFGAGLSRTLEGAAAEAVSWINDSGATVLAVDVPSGLDGTTGMATGPVVRAHRTITFFRRKPGHLLMPGRALCGDTVVADIGIPQQVLENIGPQTTANAPPLWISAYPWPAIDGHKYARGHAVVVSGPAGHTGAARLAARAALRIGAGLVTVASPRDALAENAAQLTAIMLSALDGSSSEPFAGGLASILADARKNAVLVGPGNGVGALTVARAADALASGAAVVLDADAFTSFAGHYEFDLYRAIAEKPERPVIMTPHEGEFNRVPIFRECGSTKLERARAVAMRSGAVLILKGPDTVIAAPDGRAAINENAPPTLASAGTGDVLAGLVTGLLAQRMPAFEAACAAVWLHGASADAFGPGLIAEDLTEMLPDVLRGLRALGQQSRGRDCRQQKGRADL